MSVAVTPYAIVLDNVPEWANLVSRSLRSFLPQNTEIITATSPSGVLAILREQATRTLTLFASDYHLGPGDAHLPQLLGAIHQSFGDISLRLVAFSGTHANVVTASLLKRGACPFSVRR